MQVEVEVAEVVAAAAEVVAGVEAGVAGGAVVEEAEAAGRSSR